MPSQQRSGGLVQLEQGQVVVVGLIVIVMMKMDALDPRHLLCRAAAVDQKFAKVDCPH